MELKEMEQTDSDEGLHPNSVPSALSVPSSLLLILALAWALAGCNKPFPFENTWTGNRQIEGGHSNPAVAGSAKRVTITIDPNRHFKAELDGFPLEGDVHVSGDDATLEVKTVMNKPRDQAPGMPAEIMLRGRPDGDVSLLLPNEPEAVLKPGPTPGP